jgi:hypothetical protein
MWDSSNVIWKGNLLWPTRSSMFNVGYTNKGTYMRDKYKMTKKMVGAAAYTTMAAVSKANSSTGNPTGKIWSRIGVE